MDKWHLCRTKGTSGVPQGLSRPWNSAAGFLGLCQGSAGWSCRVSRGRDPSAPSAHCSSRAFTYSFTHLASGSAQTCRSFLVMNLSGREVLQPQRGKGTRQARVTPQVRADLPCGQGYLPRGHLPSRLPSHKPPSIRGLRSLLKPREQGEIKVPWENLPMLRCSWPPSVRREPGCSAWVAGTSVASPASGQSCMWHIMCIGLITTGRSHWLHRDLLPTLYSQHQDGSRRPRRPLISQLRRMGAHTLLKGPMVAAPFPYSGYGSSHHCAPGPAGREAKSPKAGKDFAQSPGQEPVLTQPLAESTCCWCRNNPSHDSGAAFVRRS